MNSSLILLYVGLSYLIMGFLIRGGYISRFIYPYYVNEDNARRELVLFGVLWLISPVSLIGFTFAFMAWFTGYLLLTPNNQESVLEKDKKSRNEKT